MAFWLSALAVATLSAGVLIAYMFARHSKGRNTATAAFRHHKLRFQEIEREEALGLIDPEEVEGTKLEVSRRILAADRARQTEPEFTRAPRTASIAAAVASFAVIVVGAVLVYSRIGEPNFPDMPLKDRLEAAEEMRSTRPSQSELLARLPDQQIPDPEIAPETLVLIEELRNVVAERPDDLEGHRLLVSVEFGIGNYRGAAEAQEKLLGILGQAAGPDDHMQFAELLVLTAAGYISPEAEQSLLRVLELDPARPLARYFLGRLQLQTGRPDLAFQIWQELADSAPLDAIWATQIHQDLAVAALRAGINYEFPAPVFPQLDEETIDAAREMPESERRSMIEGMVSGLETRLNESGGTAEEWLQLIHSYKVLGQDDKASLALERAKAAFSDDPEALGKILTALQGIQAGQ